METSWIQVVFALALTVALVLVLAYAFKRLSGGALSSDGAIKIRSVATLGTREKLVLVTMGSDELLLGVTATQINTLHHRCVGESFERVLEDAQS